eukprot:scaffold77259_cov64-Phaeocystis_antarctica.AAC.4
MPPCGSSRARAALQASCTCPSMTAVRRTPGLRRSFEELTAAMMPDLDGVHVVASCVGQLSVGATSSSPSRRSWPRYCCPRPQFHNDRQLTGSQLRQPHNCTAAAGSASSQPAHPDRGRWGCGGRAGGTGDPKGGGASAGQHLAQA